MSLKQINRIALAVIAMGSAGLAMPRRASALPACFQGCVTLASCDDAGWVCMAQEPRCDPIQIGCGQFGTCTGTKQFVNCWESAES